METATQVPGSSAERRLHRRSSASGLGLHRSRLATLGLATAVIATATAANSIWPCGSSTLLSSLTDVAAQPSRQARDKTRRRRARPNSGGGSDSSSDDSGTRPRPGHGRPPPGSGNRRRTAGVGANGEIEDDPPPTDETPEQKATRKKEEREKRKQERDTKAREQKREQAFKQNERTRNRKHGGSASGGMGGRRVRDLKYYRLLGVKPDSDDKAIKKAYKTKALMFHPDKQVGKTEEEKKAAEDAFAEINNAYDTLGDDKKRRLYDQVGDEGMKQSYNNDDDRRF